MLTIESNDVRLNTKVCINNLDFSAEFQLSSSPFTDKKIVNSSKFVKFVSCLEKMLIYIKGYFKIQKLLKQKTFKFTTTNKAAESK